MIELAAMAIAVISLGISLVVAFKLRHVDGAPQELPIPTPLPLPHPPEKHPLEGLRIAIEITQDHPHPIFAKLLAEQLLIEDAELTESNEADIRISGKILCNGYSEIYYQADLTCASPTQTICNLIENPPHGDRPINLATELIAKLKDELEKLVSRGERRRALRELQEP